MSLTARDVMRPEPQTVSPDTTLPDLERAFLEARVSGFPVVDHGRLIGIVSRSDIVRQLSVEQSMGEMISDYYRDLSESAPAQSLEVIAAHVGRRMESLRVREVMIEGLITASPDEALREVAQRMFERRIHRLPVVDGDQLVGILTSADFLRLFAEGRVKAD